MCCTMGKYHIPLVSLTREYCQVGEVEGLDSIPRCFLCVCGGSVDESLVRVLRLGVQIPF